MTIVDINLVIPIATQSDNPSNKNSDETGVYNNLIESNSMGIKSQMTLTSAPINYSTYMRLLAYWKANMGESVLINDDFIGGNQYRKLHVVLKERLYASGSNKTCIVEITMTEV